MTGKRSYLLFGGQFNNPTIGVDGRNPQLAVRIPGEMVIPNRVREASVFVLVVRELVMDDLAIECSVREIRDSDEGGVGDIGGGRVSQGPLVAVGECRVIWKMIVGEEEPFFPSGAVLVVVGGVDADLGFEGGG